MSQRTIAGLLALPTVVALLVCALVLPLPYTILSPGETVNLLGTNGGQQIVTVGKGGPKVYRDNGQLRMVTVSVTTRSHKPRLFELLGAWANGDDAVVPFSYQYPDTQGTTQSDHTQGTEQMTSAQDAAVEVALSALGYHLTKGPIVRQVQPGSAAGGRLQVGDLIVSVNGHRVATSNQVVAATAATPVGGTMLLTVRRQGANHEVRIVPRRVDGKPRMGVSIGTGAIAPFGVDVNIPQDITGPSAGLMMALSIYDELTPGSLTGGGAVAGTGTMDQSGAVGEIGGIQQKIPGAKNDGAQLFLVPAGNCPDVANTDHGSMRLAKVTAFADALKVVQTWSKDHNAPLPSC